MPYDGASLGPYAEVVSKAGAALHAEDAITRVWRHDHTLWHDDPSEISNRLGWLDVNEQMRRESPALQAFTPRVRAAGIQHVVLLAMGGSALAPELYRATWGTAKGFPTFTMLDSTVPGQIRAVERAIDPAKTLFIVASKSGGTTEVQCLYRYFRGLVEQRLGPEAAGKQFIAITDEDTPLAETARRESFLQTFINPSDIGGRFSGLSLFGLAPAALMGVDLDAFLLSVERMRRRCGPSTSPQENPGAMLGVTMGSLAQQGVDKLTLVTSPALASFGLWVEQMLAESLGKDGAGIVPVANEPLTSPDQYGSDRLFVHLRLDGDDNAAADAHLTALEQAGKPVVRLAMADRNDLGGELFRWSFATIVAGHLLRVNPFDQPNVQRAKDLTLQELAAYEQDGRLPSVDVSSSIGPLLAQARPGDYLALLAYLPQSPQADGLLHRIRAFVLRRHHIATTAGYGPRYLHSTGQLHKGGPNTGLFLQIVAEAGEDMPIPGRPYSFSVLANAQAQGDIRALQSHQRRTARLRLTGDHLAALQGLVDSITA